MPKIEMDGKVFDAAEGRSVLDVARENKIPIPTLCHHPGLGPYGACRVCLVEVTAGGRPGLTSSCTLPATEGLKVLTGSEEVKSARGFVAELLLARAPESPEMRRLAGSLGVESTDLPQKDEKCILCGRCVRACSALGVHAIGFIERSQDRRVSVPFHRASETCLACRACVAVCPTGAVTSKITPEHVEMVEWQTTVAHARCRGCGGPMLTDRGLAHLKGIIPAEQQEAASLCPRCRRSRAAKELAGALHTEGK